MAQILESDGFVLEKLLRPFPITLGLPSDPESSTFPDENPPTVDPTDENHSYNSGVQILAHITRDWTTLGRPIRKSLYEFCILQLLIHRSEEDTNFTVLVPGAGLGRLAKDLSLDFGFHVEANEISTTMASAAFSLLHGTAEGIIHPFALDYLMNEVFSEDRYQENPFPDQEMIYNIQWTRESRQRGSLSYTVGDFIQTYSARRRSKTFDAVVTCFFIDTATNIYEYILIICHVLKERGGIWINVGPLQWHGNSKLRPSADELRLLIEAMGFSVILWTVDKDPMNYRHFDSGDGVRHTKYEGYNPLRFVVQRTQNGMDDIDVALVIRHLRNNTNTK
jgi:carnosine N-methyltransferase